MDISDRQLQLGRFWKKYLRMMRAGVPALRALEVISEEETSPEFVCVILALRAALEQGDLLSEAMQRQNPFFSRSVLEMVRAAEKGGHWDVVVGELADGYLDGTFD